MGSVGKNSSALVSETQSSYHKKSFNRSDAIKELNSIIQGRINSYKRDWDYYLNNDTNRSDEYMNLEKDLDRKIPNNLKLPEKEMMALKKVYAKQIADDAQKRLLSMRENILKHEELKAETGHYNLGFTTDTADRSEMKRMEDRFGFNCYQLSEFKKKYLS